MDIQAIATPEKTILHASPDKSHGETPVHELERSEQLFRLLVDQVKNYAIFPLDPNGHIVTWNSGAELLKGYGPQEIIGRHFGCFYIDADRQAGKPLKLLKQARDNGRVEDEGWRVRKDGSRFWADVVITALMDEKQGLLGYAKVPRDLTERRRAEESLKEVQKELEKRVSDRTAQLNQANAV